MKPICVAILLLRYASIWAFIDAAICLTELPAHILGIVGSPSGYLTSQRELAIVIMSVRLLIYIGVEPCAAANGGLAPLLQASAPRHLYWIVRTMEAHHL